MKFRSRAKTTPGTVFTFPFKGGGYGYGLVTRVAPFGPRRTELGLLYAFDHCGEAPVEHVTPEMTDPSRIVHISTCAVGHLHDGRWKQLGVLPGFTLAAWPVPPMIQPAAGPRGMVPDPSVRKIMLEMDDLTDGRLLDNTGYIRPDQEPQFPYATGLGDMRYLEGAAQMAVKVRFRLQMVEVRPDTFALWASVRAAMERDHGAVVRR
jgi:hypothetical protein